MKIESLISLLEKKIKNKKKMDEKFFLFLTRCTPMVNVDLLIKNNKKQTLLTWRQNTVKAKPGWHLPGGIVRLGETLNERVRKVGLIELGVKVKNISLKPIDFNQIILNQDNRSHFFSFLFSCELSSKPPNRILYKFESKKKVLEGQYNWFDSCPKNILKPHLIYKKYLNRI